MKIFKWLNFYSVGNDEIDNQHKKLIELINKTYDLLSSNEKIEKLNEIIAELEDYAIYHFKTEEEKFEKYQYPNKEEHINEHKEFIKKVKQYKDCIKKEKQIRKFDIFNFLRNWLHTHIVKKDKDYAKFFKNKQINNFK